jgi:hypothetical protein
MYLSNNKISILEFYSIWVTIYVIIYLLLNIILKLPKWTSPFISVICISIIQIIIFIIGWKYQPTWYIISSIIWKLLLLFITIKYISANINTTNIIWTLLLFAIYIIILYHLKNKNIIQLYYNDIRNKTTYNDILVSINQLIQ